MKLLRIIGTVVIAVSFPVWLSAYCFWTVLKALHDEVWDR